VRRAVAPRAAPGRVAIVAGAALLALIARPPAAHAARRAPPATPIESARAGAAPRNLVFMIPDGCGPASVTLARLVAGRPLALDSMLVGAVATPSASSRITDSGAGATAYASGVRTRNRAIGVDATGRSVATLLELARAAGMATAAVVKSAVTDATPAAFLAHTGNRDDEADVAVQELAHRPDLLLGGGRKWFLPAAAGGARPDSVDLLARARARGDQVIDSAAALGAVRRLPVLGLFAMGELPYAIDAVDGGPPSLPAMTTRALALLAAARRPFVLVVEGSLVDIAAHANDPAAHASEVLEYDVAVARVQAFARLDRHTLVVSVSDHECGGLTLGRRLDDSSTTDLEPEVLRDVHASARRMADSIAAGWAPDRALEQLAGIQDLSAEERALLGSHPGRSVAGAVAEIESRRAHVDWTTGCGACTTTTRWAAPWRNCWGCVSRTPRVAPAAAGGRGRDRSHDHFMTGSRASRRRTGRSGRRMVRDVGGYPPVAGRLPPGLVRHEPAHMR
jgi:alkaline phosphatase